MPDISYIKPERIWLKGHPGVGGQVLFFALSFKEGEEEKVSGLNI